MLRTSDFLGGELNGFHWWKFGTGVREVLFVVLGIA